MRDVTYIDHMITNIQIPNDNEIVKIAKTYLEDSEYALKIINGYENGNRLSGLYRLLVEDLSLEVCEDCGHIPETGACCYCKQD